jgi:hypothetical protein
MRVRIWPAPSADEAAAIEAAVALVIARGTAGAKRLRCGDVPASSAGHPTEQRELSRHLGWRDVARLESLEPGV